MDDIASGPRFKFGKNWSRFVAHINADRIRSAKESLTRMLRQSNLLKKAFLCTLIQREHITGC